MKQLLLKLYRYLPKSIINYSGRASWLQPLRNALLRKNGKLKVTAVHINRAYNNTLTSFIFHAPVRLAAKAKQSGIETVILESAVKLLSQRNKINYTVVFDIGANYGFLSLVWAGTVCSKGKVYAFEPDERVFYIFKTSVERNKLSEIIQPENTAVGDIEKEGMLTIDNYIAEKNIQQCHFMKIDVDGAEYEILQGAINSIRRFKPAFAIELNNDRRIIEFFAEEQYNMYDVKLQPLDITQPLPANIFCVAAMKTEL